MCPLSFILSKHYFRVRLRLRSRLNRIDQNYKILPNFFTVSVVSFVMRMFWSPPKFVDNLNDLALHVPSFPLLYFIISRAKILIISPLFFFTPGSQVPPVGFLRGPRRTVRAVLGSSVTLECPTYGPARPAATPGDPSNDLTGHSMGPGVVWAREGGSLPPGRFTIDHYGEFLGSLLTAAVWLSYPWRLKETP